MAAQAEARSAAAGLGVCRAAADEALALAADLALALSRGQPQDALRAQLADASAELEAASFCLPPGPLRAAAEGVVLLLARDPGPSELEELRAAVRAFSPRSAPPAESESEEEPEGPAGGQEEEGPQPPEQQRPGDDVRQQRRQLSALLRALEMCYSCLASVAECRDKLKIVRAPQYLLKFETTLAADVLRLPALVRELQEAAAAFDPASSHAQIAAAAAMVAERDENQTPSVLAALGADVAAHARKLRRAIAVRERKLSSAGAARASAAPAAATAGKREVFSDRPVGRQDFIVVSEGEGLAVPYQSALGKREVVSSEYRPSGDDLAALSLGGLALEATGVRR